MITYRQCKWTDILWRARHLMEDHCALFNIPNVDTYLGPIEPFVKLEDVNRLILAEAVDETDATVGYILWLVDRHPSLANARVAKMGPWYVAPQYRKQASTSLFQYSLDLCRKAECDYALATLPKRNKKQRKYNHSLFGRPLETTWILDLNNSDHIDISISLDPDLKEHD